MCWPSIDGVGCLSPLYARCQMSLLVRELLSEVHCDVSTCWYPDSLLCRNVLYKLLEALETTRLAYAAAVQTNGHHLGESILSFLVKSIKCRFDVVIEIVTGAESGWHTELVVIAIYPIS